MFTLKNGLIIDSLDQQPLTDGVYFKQSENSTAIPNQFSNELIYNFSKLPSNAGEFSINYETGEVFLVGNSIGEGTGSNYFFADYKCKKVYQANLDYSYYNGELNLNYLRPVFGKSIKISFDYDEEIITNQIKEELNNITQKHRKYNSFRIKISTYIFLHRI